MMLEWRQLVRQVVADALVGAPAGVIAARFHAALVAAACEVARAVDAPVVALSGGCFQNRRLTEGLAAALEADGRRVLLHAQVPPNDGGIAFGQVAVAAARLTGG
jgi:hydrogenase maturation protein HypF